MPQKPPAQITQTGPSERLFSRKVLLGMQILQSTCNSNVLGKPQKHPALPPVRKQPSLGCLNGTVAAQQLSFLGGNVVIRILVRPSRQKFLCAAVFSRAGAAGSRAVLAAVNRDFALCTVLRMGGIMRSRCLPFLQIKAVIRFVIAQFCQPALKERFFPIHSWRA